MGAPTNFGKDGKKIQFQELRAGLADGGLEENLDIKFRSIIDRLEDSYYGTGEPGSRALDGWKHGESNPFIFLGKSFDVQATPELSKALFDGLHGVLWALHLYTFHWIAQKVMVPAIDPELYRYIRDGQGVLVVDKIKEAKQTVKNFTDAQDWPPTSVRARVNSALRGWFIRQTILDVADPIYDTV